MQQCEGTLTNSDVKKSTTEDVNRELPSHITGRSELSLSDATKLVGIDRRRFADE
jgi:hypothetical protein